ncbi:MAG: ArsC family reductase [Gammaproteobacteria bacterium]|nr:ArsC family reductase [Gammaproteobacteria bacterium]
MKMYGIKNCSTVKKARAFLEKHHIDYEFHDFKTDGVTKTLLNAWLKHVDWQILLNRQGLTWKRLPASTRENINKTNALAIMLEQPSIIKRPVLNIGSKVLVGFNEDEYRKI